MFGFSNVVTLLLLVSDVEVLLPVLSDVEVLLLSDVEPLLLLSDEEVLLLFFSLDDLPDEDSDEPEPPDLLADESIGCTVTRMEA